MNDSNLYKYLDNLDLHVSIAKRGDYMIDLDIHELSVIAIAYLESHQDELNAFIKCNPDIEDDYNTYSLQNEDEQDDDFCSTLAEYVEYNYWHEFVKFHDSYLPLMK